MRNTLLLRALRVLAVIAVPAAVVTVCWGQGARNRAGVEQPGSLNGAALDGDVQQLKTLLDRGHLIRADEHGLTPLAVAAYGGQSQVVSLLLSRQAALARVVDDRGRTPLHWAAMGGHREVIEQLLREGIDVNAADRDGQTPLHLAALFGQSDAFALLIEHGGDLAATDTDGCTPIDLAREAGDQDLREVADVAELESQIDN